MLTKEDYIIECHKLTEKNKLLTEALEGMKRLNLHLYEEGTVGNMCYKEMIEALNKTKN